MSAASSCCSGWLAGSSVFEGRGSRLTLEGFLTQHGLLALGLIATVEGDLSLVVAGVLAHAGFFPWWAAVVAGATGNLAGDCVWFSLGRFQSDRIRRSAMYRHVGSRVEGLARRLGPGQLLAARVVYGTRNASMALWGILHLQWTRFLAVDAVGCLLAGLGFVGLGWLLGNGTSSLLGDVRRVEHWLLIAVVLAAVSVWIISHYSRRRLRQVTGEG
jgi:membrane protein DedA with SNARE-associated domain